ncbi:MAG TPA: hypothetical protein VN756_05125, partial [Solirubrobacterales bacterium]|nr:hypothetical protein [Solirubrobacterales bacterium]
MARQARNYLAGAVSGTALIGIAVVAFVMLVSLQTLRDWPLAALGGNDSGDSAVVAPETSAAAGANGPGSAVNAGSKGNVAAGAQRGSQVAGGAAA